MSVLDKINDKYMNHYNVRWMNIDIIPGDTYVVEYYSSINKKQVKAFTGICIAVSKRGVNKRIVLYKTLKDVGVVFSCYLGWNNLLSIRRVSLHNVSGKRRRAKQYVLVQS